MLTLEDGADTVSFTYDADGAAGEKTLRLTWKLTFPQRPAGLTIDEAAFPDEHFRAYLEANCDQNGDGILSDEEIHNVKTLDISGLEIASLSGAEVFTELKSLNCSNNALTGLSTKNWPRLETFHCSFNALADLDLSENSRLKELNCAHNGLSALDVTDCPELRVLDCRDNTLTELNVSRNDRLEVLSCGENALEELDAGRSHVLAELNCDYNRLHALTLPESGSLRVLSCNYNALTRLDLEAQRNLVWLFVGGNQLAELDVSGLTGLEKLDIPRNLLPPSDPGESAREDPPAQTQEPAQPEPCTDGHSFGPWIDQVRPTCAETGLKAHRDCEICGRHFDKNDREIQDLTLPKEPSNHRHTEKTPRVEPTCTEDGVTAGVYCQDCGTYLTGHAALPARHTLGSWIRGTKDTPGHLTCKICGKHFDAQGNEITID